MTKLESLQDIKDTAPPYPPTSSCSQKQVINPLTTQPLNRSSARLWVRKRGIIRIRSIDVLQSVFIEFVFIIHQTTIDYSPTKLSYCK